MKDQRHMKQKLAQRANENSPGRQSWEIAGASVQVPEGRLNMYL